MTNEDAVTDILISRAILKRSYDMADKMYSTNPQFDLSSYLSTKRTEPSRFGPKYIFVK